MSRFRQFFQNRARPLVIGVVHLDGLPGTPRHSKSLDQIAEKAKKEARILADEGADGIIVENMGDIPFVRPSQSGPEIVSCMTRMALDVRRSIASTKSVDLLWGISFLAACNVEALAVAKAADFDFVRVEGFVFAHVADEGLIDGCAGNLLRYRKKIEAENVAVIADVKKKHSSHSITSDVSLSETIEAAEFFSTDGVIITGTSTGHAPKAEAVREAKEASRTTVWVGSGATSENVHEFLPFTDAFIVGSDFKIDGRWENEIEASRVRRFVKRVRTTSINKNH